MAFVKTGMACVARSMDTNPTQPIPEAPADNATPETPAE